MRVCIRGIPVENKNSQYHTSVMLNKLRQFKQVLKLIPLIAQPGAGKGTLGGNLTAILDPGEIQVIVMSKIIEERSKAFDDLGRRLAQQKNKSDAGDLADDGPVMEALEERIIQLYDGGAQRIMLDGSIRTTPQAKALIASEVPFTTIHLVCGNEVAIERIKCRAEKEKRPDDANINIIMGRIKTYQDKTTPVLKLLRDHNPREYHTIITDGEERTITIRALRALGYTGEEMQRICSKLDAHLAHKKMGKTNRSHGFYQPTAEKLGELAIT